MKTVKIQLNDPLQRYQYRKEVNRKLDDKARLKEEALKRSERLVQEGT